jgi:YaiO family outer membrane protein
LLIAAFAATAAQAQRQPQVDASIEAARAAQARGDSAAALAAFEAAAAAAPDDAELLRLLGTAQGQAGRTDAALATLERAQRLAPNDIDIRLAIGRVRYYRGEHRAALDIAEAVLALQPDNGDAKDLAERTRRALAEGGGDTRWRLDWSAGYSGFEDDARERWLEGSAALGYRVDDRTGVTARADIADRFGRTDVYGEARIDRRFGEGRSGYLAFGVTPDADFLPEFAVVGGFGVRAWRGAAGDGVITLDARYAEYGTGSVETLSPGIEQYLPGGRAWLTARAIVTWDEDGDRQAGYLVRGDVQASRRARLFVGYADAPETAENVTLTTRSVFAGGVFDLSDRLVLRLDYARDDRERSYVRHAVTAGFGVRF